MTETHPHPSPLLVLAALCVLPFLWSCTAEPPATPAGSRATARPAAPTAGPSGNHPPSVLSARNNPADVTLGTEVCVGLDDEDSYGAAVTCRYAWAVVGARSA